MSYARFAAMIATSTVIMFGLMYLNTYAATHVFFSETRAFMAVLMGATMAVVMISFMFTMYPSRAVNLGILGGGALVFAVMLWLVRSQATVGDASYLRAMIPHHSIALLTSERAQIDDPRVRKLADEIIEAQRREISEMRYLIAALEGPEASPERIIRPQPGSEGRAAVDATVIANLDPAPLAEPEIRSMLPRAPGCRFRWTESSGPIFVAWPTTDGGAAGTMKLYGRLVPLTSPDGAVGDGARLRADGIAVTVRPDAPIAPGEERAAELTFELDRGLRVGYRGLYRCEP